ncbi:MAG: site-specific DNA-methyltransferase [Armatimonadota bacterium]|nr:site-specific DNA-methyltransferase [Armatimonadota bacterium]
MSSDRLPEPARRDPVAYLVELRQTLPRVTDAAQIPPRLALIRAVLAYLGQYRRPAEQALREAVVTRLEHERRLGELLAGRVKRGPQRSQPPEFVIPDDKLPPEFVIPDDKLPPGVSRNLSMHAQTLARASRAWFESVKAAILSGERRIAVREIYLEARRQIARTSQVVQLPNLLVGDFRTVGAQIPDNSVALVLTDPPYGRDSLSLYGDVAAFAARVLMPGGSLVVYAPTYALPEVFSMMTDHLRFWWAFALVHTGRRALVRSHGVRTAWKPLLWFIKGGRADTQRIIEDIVEGREEKTEHEWRQGVAEAATIIERLTDSGDCVVDPMAGSGTTLLAAQAVGRRGIGIEINPDTAALAARRLAEGDGGLQTRLCGVLSTDFKTS